MTFESKVMAVVTDVLGADDMNGFFSGTLFVTCFPGDAKTLLKRLTADFGKVQMTAQAGHMEFAYDFVA